jgi:hypothetical protein
MDHKLNDLLLWAKQDLINTKFAWANDNLSIVNPKVMYGYNDSLPDISHIKKNGCNSIGLINLMRLKLNRSIPGKDNPDFRKYKMIGSISSWTRFLKDDLKEFNPDDCYEVGTLLIKKANQYSQGHVAIVIGHNTIMHSYPYNQYYSRNLSEPGICISNWNQVNKYIIDKNNISFNYYCEPSIWLQKE